MKAFLAALAVSAALVAGMIYFIRELWPILPGWLAMIGFIVLAVIVIGYPIYTLARWSNKHWAQTQKDRDSQ